MRAENPQQRAARTRELRMSLRMERMIAASALRRAALHLQQSEMTSWHRAKMDALSIIARAHDALVDQISRGAA